MAIIDKRVLSKTVKAMAPKKERINEAQVRGTIVLRGGDHYILLDGAPNDSLTPISNIEEILSESGFVTGDRVLVLIKNHQAIVTKNLTTGLQAQSAKVAKETAEEAERSAHEAIGYAREAETSAQEAKASADEAKDSAYEANQSANEAKADAAVAHQKALEANESANGAVTSLGIVQGVVEDLGKDMDEMETHVAMMDAIKDEVGRVKVPAGLHVVPTANGYFLVISNDGVYVYDNESNLVTTLGENVIFDSSRPQYIGSDEAFIIFNPRTNQIQIGGNVVFGSDLSVDTILGEVTNFEIVYELNSAGTQATFRAYIFRGDVEVTDQYDPRCFSWYYKTESGEAPINNIDGNNYGYSMIVNLEDLNNFEYEGHIITNFTKTDVDYYIQDGHLWIRSDSIAPRDIGEFFMRIDEYGDLIYEFDDQTVADFEIRGGKLYALNQYGIFGKRLSKETALYKKNALHNALSGKASTSDSLGTVQTLYRSVVSGTLSVDPPTTWVNNPNGAQNTWTSKRPVYSSDYPVLFVCQQWKFVDGEVDYTTPVMDDTTTVIDGGHITTGTIDAKRINAFNVNTGQLNSDRINTGAIAIGSLNGGADVVNQTKIYTFDSTTASEGYWLRLGTLKTAAAANTIFEIYTGDGYNGDVNQNSEIRIRIKTGNGADSVKVFGATVERIRASSARVKITDAAITSASDQTCAVWVYMPWQFRTGYYTVKGTYTLWTHNLARSVDEPSGTAQSVEYRSFEDNITKIDEDGIRIHPSSTENNSIVINTNGMEVFKGGTNSSNSVAFYGDTARVGNASSKNTYTDSNGVHIRNVSTVLSEFTENGANIGKNSNTATIKLCGEKLEINGSYSDDDHTYTATIKHVTELSSSMNQRSLSIMNGNTTSIELNEDAEHFHSIAGTAGSASMRLMSPKMPSLHDYFDVSCPISVGGSRIIKTDTFTTESVTVSGGGYATISVDVTKTNYYAAGIIGYQITGTNSQNVVPYRMYIVRSNGVATAEARVRNVGSNSYTISVTFEVLYISATQAIGEGII